MPFSLSSILLLLLFVVSCAKKTDTDITADTAHVDTSPNAMMGQQTGGLSAQDQQFVVKALRGNKAEVDLGNLAVSKAKVDDHTKALNELIVLASSKAMTIDTADTPELTQLKEKLSKLSSKAFDKEYISVMVKDHEKARDDFQLEATSGSDAAIRAYAQKHLDAITQHLQQARGMDTVALATVNP